MGGLDKCAWANETKAKDRYGRTDEADGVKLKGIQAMEAVEEEEEEEEVEEELGGCVSSSSSTATRIQLVSSAVESCPVSSALSTSNTVSVPSAATVQLLQLYCVHQLIGKNSLLLLFI